MSSPTPDYYEILGLPPTATPDEVKRRYRELARRYHPDVAGTKDAADRFTEINEANSVLSDAARRANYDAHRKLNDLKRQGAAAPKPNTSRPNAPAPKTPHPATQQPKTQEEVHTILREAQRAMSRLKFREAEALARRANRIRRTSLGFEILGDVLRSRGKADEAVAMYSYSLQLDRGNRDAQAKFDRLVGKPSGPTMSGNAARAARGPVRSGPPRRNPARLAVVVASTALLVLLLFFSARIGSPATGPWFIEWDPLYQLTLAASGGATGFLLAASGALLPARRALLDSRTGRGAGSIPLGPLLMAFGLLSIYAAFIVFLVVGFLADRLQKSVLAAFASAAAVTLIFAIVNTAAAGWTLLSGGNLVFIGLLCGWFGAAGFQTETTG